MYGINGKIYSKIIYSGYSRSALLSIVDGDKSFATFSMVIEDISFVDGDVSFATFFDGDCL
jgi:hypothetical protein